MARDEERKWIPAHHHADIARIVDAGSLGERAVRDRRSERRCLSKRLENFAVQRLDALPVHWQVERFALAADVLAELNRCLRRNRAPRRALGPGNAGVGASRETNPTHSAVGRLDAESSEPRLDDDARETTSSGGNVGHRGRVLVAADSARTPQEGASSFRAVWKHLSFGIGPPGLRCR
jgi:hypothetical protein